MKTVLIIILTLLAAILVGVMVAQAATVPWPSISPSYRCDDGLAVFVLYNVGADMGNGAQYTVSTPHRVFEHGVFWLAAGGHTEYWYNAPGIPLTFAYARPDNGAMVSMTQTCGVRPLPTATPIVRGTGEHRWFAPWVAP